MNQKPGNQRLVRATNQQLILDTVIKQGPVSRATLAKMIKLSVPSVSSNIETLISRNLIYEAGIEDLNSIGRPPIMLKFNERHSYIIGIDLGREDIIIALGDLLGNTVAERHIKISLEKKITVELFGHISQFISELLDENKVALDQLKVIVAATPGIINRATGYFEAAPRFEEWKQLNLEQFLSSRFKSKVIIINDMNAAILGESKFGVAKDYQNVVAIGIDVGIGAGILLNGKIFEGTRMASGELGYWISSTKVNEAGAIETVNLDSKLSIHSLMMNIKAELASGQSSELFKLCNKKIEKIDFEMFIKAVELGDNYSLNKIREITQELAPVISNISLFLDLEMIVLCGKITQLGYAFIQPLREIINQINLFPPTVIYSALGSRAGINGAYSVALEYAMQDILREE